MIKINIKTEDDLYDLFRVQLVAKFSAITSDMACEVDVVNDLLVQIRNHQFDDFDLRERINWYFTTPWRSEDGIPFKMIEILKEEEPELSKDQLLVRIEKVTFPYLLNDALKAILHISP